MASPLDDKKLKDELQTLRETMKALKKEERTLLKQEASTISQYRFGILTFIIALSGWTSRAAMLYIAHANLLEGKKEEEAERIRLKLETWLANVSDEQKGAMLISGGPPIRASQFRTAEKFVKEMHLHDWVEQENIVKGIAPASRTVLDALEAITSCKDIASVMESLPPPIKKKQRKWLSQWRSRWGVAISSIEPRCLLEPAIMLEKA
jgi:hypothetical protein